MKRFFVSLTWLNYWVHSKLYSKRINALPKKNSQTANTVISYAPPHKLHCVEWPNVNGKHEKSAIPATMNGKVNAVFFYLIHWNNQNLLRPNIFHQRSCKFFFNVQVENIIFMPSFASNVWRCLHQVYEQQSKWAKLKPLLSNIWKVEGPQMKSRDS